MRHTVFCTSGRTQHLYFGAFLKCLCRFVELDIRRIWRRRDRTSSASILELGVAEGDGYRETTTPKWTALGPWCSCNPVPRHRSIHQVNGSAVEQPKAAGEGSGMWWHEHQECRVWITRQELCSRFSGVCEPRCFAWRIWKLPECWTISFTIQLRGRRG